jgi:hypothetical protein
MGGHISVGVRRADGSFRTIGVWTNPLGSFMRERAFRVDGSLEPLDRFFARYLKDDADFGGPQETVPGEYGYVLVDDMTKTITYINSYSSPHWLSEDDFGFVSVGRMYASQEALDEMAEMRESAIRARYTIPGGDGWTFEDLPAFTTHEAMLSLMEELSRRGLEVALEKKLSDLAAAITAAEACIQKALDAENDNPETDADLKITSREVEWAVSRFKRCERDHRVFVRYEIAFPAWKIVDLSWREEEDFLKMQAAVEACVDLTDAEKAAWKEEFEGHFRQEPEEEPSWTATLSEENLAILTSDEDEED